MAATVLTQLFQVHVVRGRAVPGDVVINFPEVTSPWYF